MAGLMGSQFFIHLRRRAPRRFPGASGAIEASPRFGHWRNGDDRRHVSGEIDALLLRFGFS